MTARLNIVAGYQNWEGYDAFVAQWWYLYWSAHQAPASISLQWHQLHPEFHLSG
ncbi:hypothetical protein PILCRDRAFT_121925 [Piloderma croceum F 1598]|uniref:Uncharacterized protein n=1 Tax=Piloderma croceum (strain F 1598) TaxID=765440 RepID=A0A0C3CRU0_PILCF|nr:hypothetical protein PILCRDRAFT_121925 [Piloderma croceum F 1598]